VTERGGDPGQIPSRQNTERMVLVSDGVFGARELSDIPALNKFSRSRTGRGTAPVWPGQAKAACGPPSAKM